MKSYTTVVHGRDICRFIQIPGEYIDADLQVTIRPVKDVKTCKKKVSFFDKYQLDLSGFKFNREEANER